MEFSYQVRVTGHRPTSDQSRRCYCTTCGWACQNGQSRPRDYCWTVKKKMVKK